MLQIVLLFSFLAAVDSPGSPSPGAALSDTELRDVVIRGPLRTF